jgi:hypothetical protein
VYSTKTPGSGLFLAVDGLEFVSVLPLSLRLFVELVSHLNIMLRTDDSYHVRSSFLKSTGSRPLPCS